MENKILETYLKTNKSRAALAQQFNCSEWTIRNVLKSAPARYHCKQCNKALYGKNRTFCSKECFRKHKRKYKTCQICSAPLIKTTNIKYCDKCSANLTTQSVSELISKRRNILLKMRNNRCQNCNYKKCKSALHFHHRNPSEKKFTLSGNGLSGHTWDAILIEVAKCDLICANCHIEIEETIRRHSP